MIRQTLGLFDIICALVLLTSSFLPGSILRTVGIYLIIKGLLFGLILGIGCGGMNFVSIIDAAIGVYLLLGFSTGFFNTIFFIFLVQKGIFSLF